MNVLKDMGYDVPAIASSGEEAIKKAEEIKPDLVLMNIGLKGDMEGIDAAAHIHNRFNIPIVYVTAYMDEKRLERAKVTEPFSYIIKPFEDKELSSTIEKALGGNPKERL
jgi:CheY-like chemotaxis protein